VRDHRIYLALHDLGFGAMHRNIWGIVFAHTIYAVCMLPLHPLVMVALIKLGAITWLSSLSVWPAFLLGSAATLALLCAASYVSYH
jgi:hypothetical protein